MGGSAGRAERAERAERCKNFSFSSFTLSLTRRVGCAAITRISSAVTSRGRLVGGRWEAGGRLGGCRFTGIGDGN